VRGGAWLSSWTICFAVGVVFLTTCAQQVYAFRMEGYLRSHLYLRQERLRDPDEEYYLPIRQYMTLHLSEFSQPGWSFHSSGWVRQDLTNDESDYAFHRADDSFESELLTGYLEYRDPNRFENYARFGRQYVFWGGIYERFDGATISRELPGGHGWALFGGIPAISDYDNSRTRNRVGGARVWFRPVLGSELGFTYVRKTEAGDLDREVWSQDFFWRPCHWLEISEHASYDDITDTVVDWAVYAALKPHHTMKLSFSYDESIPGALLPATSILSVFSNDKIQEFAVGLDWYPDPNWSAWAEVVNYNTESPGGKFPEHRVDGRSYWEYRLGTRYYYADDAHMSLELRHVDPPERGIPFVEGSDEYESIDNGFDRLRFTNHCWLNEMCWTSFDVGATHYRDGVNGSRQSFDVSTTLGFRPSSRLEASATLRYVDSAVDNTEFQGLFTVTYWFDRRIKNGVTQDLLLERDHRDSRWRPHTTLPVERKYSGNRIE